MCKFFIGPMTKNVVDSVIDFSNEFNISLGLIASRRQIEINGGYVNNWTTKEFCEYVREKSKNVILVRDHCGPLQGQSEDDGIESFIEDCKYFDIIHLDVWKKYPELDRGIDKTIEFINLGLSINTELFFEIGTEESIRPFQSKEIDRLTSELRSKLETHKFERIKYLVVQSGDRKSVV
jgi:hypothetical protein